MKASLRYRFVATTLWFSVIVASTAFATEKEFIRVKRVVDGDTVLLENGERVRLLGVNAPRHSKTTIESFGKEATEFTKSMVEGKLVRLEFDPYTSRRDKSSRTLAYVFLADGTFLNAEIIRQGYGFAVKYTPPLKYEPEFVQLELKAKEHRRGLWANAKK
jgi:micrococcal nuclease